MKELSENLKRLRESRNVSKSELARLLNIAPSAYSAYETGLKKVGDREPNLTNLIKLADFFNVTVDELLNYHVDEYERCKDFWKSAGFEVVDFKDKDGNFIAPVLKKVVGEKNLMFYSKEKFIEDTQIIEIALKRQNSEYLKIISNLILRDNAESIFGTF